MKEVLLILVTFLSVNSYAQDKQKTIWDSLKVKSTDYYELKVPHDWRDFGSMAGSEQHYEASGLVLPAYHEQSPVIMTIFLYKTGCKDLEECKENCLRGYDRWI